MHTNVVTGVLVINPIAKNNTTIVDVVNHKSSYFIALTLKRVLYRSTFYFWKSRLNLWVCTHTRLNYKTNFTLLHKLLAIKINFYLMFTNLYYYRNYWVFVHFMCFWCWKFKRMVSKECHLVTKTKIFRKLEKYLCKRENGSMGCRVVT